MDYQFSVLLYSKYSQLCTQLLNDLEIAPVNLQIAARLRPVCIDNEKVRNQIYKSANINVSVLPCVLLVYAHGGVEKYEGETAFQWADETIRKFLPPPPALAPPVSADFQPEYMQEYAEPTPIKPRKVQAKKMLKKLPVQQDDSDDSEVEEILVKKSKPKAKRKPNIQELHELSDDEEEQPRRPPASVRTGSGTYEFSDEYNTIDDEPPKSNMTGRVREPSSAQSIKSGDLMAAALAMQKEREVTEPNQRGSGIISGQQGPI